MSERQRMLAKLLLEVGRAEDNAADHAAREERRIGDAPPVEALRDVADHATALRPRFERMVREYELTPSYVAAVTPLRDLVLDRVTDPERAFRTALLDLRYGLDLVKLLRDTAWEDEVFGVLRWCDDWLGVRRTLVLRVEAQLPWFSRGRPDANLDGPNAT
jgi:hypothetical protein